MTDQDGNFCVLPYPKSCCGYYDGRVMCFHLLGLMRMFMLVQTFGTNKEIFEKYLPGPLQERQNELVLIKNCAREDGQARSCA